jgi:predicted transglutaminase-like cysteine proteinase
VITIAIAAFAVATAAFAAQDFGLPQRESFMRAGELTSQPIGHYEFCKRYEAECSIKSIRRSKATVTSAGWDMLRQVNAEVNARIVPMTDHEIFGRTEVWTYPIDVGDCEDYVLEKRKLLLARGFSEADLLITVVRKYDGTGHAVLTVSTSEGDFVLDNLDTDVKKWSETPYHYLKRQSSSDTGRWVEIENCPDDIPVSSIE